MRNATGSTLGVRELLFSGSAELWRGLRCAARSCAVLCCGRAGRCTGGSTRAEGEGDGSIFFTLWLPVVEAAWPVSRQRQGRGAGSQHRSLLDKRSQRSRTGRTDPAGGPSDNPLHITRGLRGSRLAAACARGLPKPCCLLLLLLWRQRERGRTLGLGRTLPVGNFWLTLRAATGLSALTARIYLCSEPCAALSLWAIVSHRSLPHLLLLRRRRALPFFHPRPDLTFSSCTLLVERPAFCASQAEAPSAASRNRLALEKTHASFTSPDATFEAPLRPVDLRDSLVRSTVRVPLLSAEATEA